MPQFLRRWWWLVLLWLTLPYFLAWGRQGEAWRFTGFLFGVEDGNSYIAKMQLGAAGQARFTTPYTLEPQAGYWLFGPYLTLGWLTGRWFPQEARHEVLVGSFHVLRIAAALFLAWALAGFLRLWLPPQMQSWAWVVAYLGGGVGWLPWLWGQAILPFSWYSPEGFGFLMPLGLPHLALARGLELLWLTQAWRAAREGIQTRGWWLPAVLGWVHGFALVFIAVWGTLLLTLSWWQARGREKPLWRLPQTRFLGLSLLTALPWLVYFLYLQRDPFIQAWTAQNRLPTPELPMLLLSYAPLLPWAIPGWQRLYQRQQGAAWLFCGWLAAAVTLAYSPHPIQRRFLEGVWVALAVLAGLGLAPRPRWRWFTAGLTLVGPLLFWGNLLVQAWTPGLPAFRPVDEVRVFRYLAAHARVGDPVLAAYETGNALPAWAPVRVPLGLGPESVRFPYWEQTVGAFFQETLPPEHQLRWLRQWGFRWVFYGPAERQAGPWNPDESPFLRLHIRVGEYALYEVVP